MADETTTEGTGAANGEGTRTPEEMQRIIDKVHAEATRPVSPLRTQRELAWQRLQRAEGAPIPCTRCTKPTLLHVNQVCRECFIAGADARPTPLQQQAGGATCGFCARSLPPTPNASDAEPTKYFRADESIIRGAAGGVICSSCAATAVGAGGARNPTEARAMMATAQMQQQAVQATNALLLMAQQLCMAEVTTEPGKPAEQPKLAQADLPKADLLLTLGEAAEKFARIARGGDK